MTQAVGALKSALAQRPALRRPPLDGKVPDHLYDAAEKLVKEALKAIVANRSGKVIAAVRAQDEAVRLYDDVTGRASAYGLIACLPR